MKLSSYFYRGIKGERWSTKTEKRVPRIGGKQCKPEQSKKKKKKTCKKDRAQNKDFW